MEISGLGIAGIIFFNAVVCVLLPRLITLNWFEVLKNQPQEVREEVPVQ